MVQTASTVTRDELYGGEAGVCPSSRAGMPGSTPACLWSTTVAISRSRPWGESYQYVNVSLSSQIE